MKIQARPGNQSSLFTLILSTLSLLGRFLSGEGEGDGEEVFLRCRGSYLGNDLLLLSCLDLGELLLLFGLSGLRLNRALSLRFVLTMSARLLLLGR